MFHVVLFEPEIPPNTGNVIRLCANTGARLHLIKPLGFVLSDKALARAGLDYHQMAHVSVHESWPAFRAAHPDGRVYASTTRGTIRHDEAAFAPGDILLFGSETRGLPQWLHDELGCEQRLRIPMQGVSRSMNLSNAVAVVLYEAWRQNGFDEGA
ncbi:tRNA (uridine(34)/cytosine(34)/5-carboxymethylaminomethyluridine(34)-2'-O)-methyltransferase TrmL [Nitrogeniibacter mangrovi]|uniref:tRNA (cytidine(34)-2'-O)-methyltransferase n=1 Tax=Nitrogeniibacter mangrovi TaxID=2016596 RepID=A0A6C1B4U4_9RHOO|nr:tRNA (uridine(34)/cytosine(34)/5-carboxymethylaminomethyluridine(34)-2'-O)-methyltransferase TrmL [Nitrogeniibacter mangrovi]QID18497.1 tRNA (uridine(34)/cytosine(34)/5-carboxymethylaminomethyluridine(34)-2'-O)-methyltransferase TrmL [Nitrogeniibacter mangrovi]